MGQQVRTG